MRLAGRAVAYFERFFIAAENLGIVNAVKLFAVVLFRVHSDDSVLHVTRLKRDIHLRGVADKGVMAHFFIPGYQIVDTPLQRVHLIVDAGANIGDETIRFRHFHPEATIIALEPHPGNFHVLKKNVEADPNTVAIQKGLWSHECTLNLIASSSNEGFSVTKVPSGTGNVEATSVDAILALPFIHDRSLTEVDILKLDIEGAEYEVFSRNYESWIHRVKVIIVECADKDRPGTTQAMFRALSGLDFNTYVSGENIVLIRRDVPWQLKTSAYLD